LKENNKKMESSSYSKPLRNSLPDISLNAMKRHYINQQQQNIQSISHQDTNSNNDTKLTIFNMRLILDKIDTYIPTETLFILTSVSRCWRLIWLPYLYRRNLTFPPSMLYQYSPFVKIDGFLDWITNHVSYILYANIIHPVLGIVRVFFSKIVQSYKVWKSAIFMIMIYI